MSGLHRFWFGAFVLAALVAAPVALEAMGVRPALLPPCAEEVRGIRGVVGKDFEGIAEGNAKLLAEAWDSSARVQHVRLLAKGGDVVVTDPVTEAFKTWATKPHPRSSGFIQRIDVVSDRMAVARVILRFEGTNFNDFLTLFKINGQWKIVNILSARHPQGGEDKQAGTKTTTGKQSR